MAPDSFDSTGNILDTGIVVRSFPDQEAYDVTLDKAGVTAFGCLSVVGGIFLPFFGFKLHARLAVGTKVIVLRSTPCYILSTMPAEPPDLEARGVNTATTGDADIRDMGSDQASYHHMSHAVPKDVLEGEFNILNALKVGVQFLTTLVKLQAGDRAKVECFVMDDLVRIVSGSFKHLSAFGDFSIQNDNGQVNCVWRGTSYDHEAWGVMQQRDPRVASDTGGKLAADPVAETGRWRFSQFVGHLGDFVHCFLHDPPATLGNLAQELAGKLHVHAGADGSLLVRSVTDISFELVSRIPVPVETLQFDDPSGDTPGEPSAEFLDVWRVNPERPWDMAYLIRDYARWLGSYHAYARFLQKSKDWKVPSEAESPAPSLAGMEKDKEQAIPVSQRRPRSMYSCIRQMRDGSHVFIDGYGGSYVASGGSCVISMPVDVRIEAGRDLILVAGRSIFGKARQNIELTAVTGALLAKACTRLALWVERGTLLLRSLMKAGPSDGDPKAHRFQRDTVGIVMDAPKADVLVSSGRQCTVEGEGKDAGDSPGLLLRTGGGDMHLRTSRDKGVYVAAGTFASRVKLWSVTATEAWKAISPAMNFGNLLAVARGKLEAMALTLNQLRASRIVHGTEVKRSKDQHTNHVFHSKVEDVTVDTSGATDEADKKIPTPAAGSRTEADLVRPVCDYLTRDEYGRDPLPQAPAQQIADHPGAAHPAAGTFDVWDFSHDADHGDSAAVNKLPWPGSGAQMLAPESEAVLHQPSSQPPESFKPNSDTLSPRAFVFNHWKSP